MSISAIILSGGRGTRMGGVDKGLVLLENKPLIKHVITRLQPQVDELLINANREITEYEAFGHKVLPDEIANFAGPLAGIQLGLLHAQHDYVLGVPCDSPLLPLNLTQRLMDGLIENNADVAVASSDGNAHPVFCLCKKYLRPSLEAFLHNGGRKVSAWQKSQAYCEVDFSDFSEAFVNLNTFEELATLELKLQHV